MKPGRILSSFRVLRVSRRCNAGSGCSETCLRLPEIVQKHANTELHAHSRTYVPSLRRDEGTTRSSVLGSTIMPDVDLSGSMGGSDIEDDDATVLSYVRGIETNALNESIWDNEIIGCSGRVSLLRGCVTLRPSVDNEAFYSVPFTLT